MTISLAFSFSPVPDPPPSSHLREETARRGAAVDLPKWYASSRVRIREVPREFGCHRVSVSHHLSTVGVGKDEIEAASSGMPASMGIDAEAASCPVQGGH